MLLPNGAQIYFAHKRKILVVVFCRFLFRQENALEILLLDKITRKTPMIQYMVKFWLFCRDLGMFSENPTFAQLFWKIHQDFRENMNFGSIRSSSFQPLSSTIKTTGFLGCFLVLLKKAKGKLKDPGKTGWTYPKWWLFLHGDDHPGIDRTKKKIPLKQTNTSIWDEKGWSCPSQNLSYKSTPSTLWFGRLWELYKNCPIFVRKKSTELSSPQSDTLVMMPGKISFLILGASKKKVRAPTIRKPQPPPWGRIRGGQNGPSKISHLEGMLGKVLRQDSCALREDQEDETWDRDEDTSGIPRHAGCNPYHQDWEMSFLGSGIPN